MCFKLAEESDIKVHCEEVDTSSSSSIVAAHKMLVSQVAHRVAYDLKTLYLFTKADITVCILPIVRGYILDLA